MSSIRQKIVDQMINNRLPVIRKGVTVTLFTDRLYTFQTDIGRYVVYRKTENVEDGDLPRIEVDDTGIALIEPKNFSENLNRLPMNIYVGFEQGCEDIIARAAIADLNAALGVDPHLTDAETGQRLARWVEVEGSEMAKDESGTVITAVQLELEISYVAPIGEQ